VNPIVAAALVAGAAAGVAVAPATAPARLRGTGARARRPRPTADNSPSGPLSRRAAATVAGGAVALIIGVPVGVLAGVVVGVVTERFLRRLEPLAQRRRRLAIGRDFPVSLDLLAACLVAGVPLDRALRAVIAGVGGPVAAELAVVLGAIELGAAEDAWGLLRDPQLAAAGRVLARGSASGAPVAETTAVLATEHRAAARTEAEAAARRAGVAAVAPLAACFLPAFGLVTVVPIVAGLAQRVLT
jgi:pilus assembly protein TadC